MYILLILFVSFRLIHCQCNYPSKWFNENHPWDINSKGNDIERFALIQAKYPSIFDINPWTGLFEIRNASYQQTIDNTMLIENYTKISDGFICHAIQGKQCIDYEIRFCLEYNPCSVSTYSPNENHIIDGSEARAHSLPWHVSIQYNEQHICSGTLIDNQHILTTAHCFQQSLIPIPYSVVLGAHYLSNSTYRIPIDRFIFHSDYNSQTSENNIGLIKLSERIDSFSNQITPACLARSTKQSDKSNPLIVAGWRTIKNNTWSVSETDELRQTVLTVMNECSDVYKNKKYNLKKEICAGTKYSKRDLCQGDDGSGLFEKQNHDIDRWILVGIMNYGCDCAQQGYPGVYIRISAYYDWIQNTIHQINK
ncbi:unnamed protein product [Adineta steineri]|uniref:Peptidase S1 domain-containing protein n=1 Tax=Adineta steineri TaxID=433720 RepID=A0A814C085_9BILA|nr:unnamed protein product [Adineta steineri]